jgi:hypothetical protein
MKELTISTAGAPYRLKTKLSPPCKGGVRGGGQGSSNHLVVESKGDERGADNNPDREQRVTLLRSTNRVHATPAATFVLAIVWALCPQLRAQEPTRPAAATAPAPKLTANRDAVRSAIDQLVKDLRQYPARPSKSPERIAGLYLVEVKTGEVTLIADDPQPGPTFCGSAAWSNDGKRILFDAMDTKKVALAHMKVIEQFEGQLTVTDLGVGNCPVFSPSGDQIAFLLNHGGVPGAQGGLWLMQADGSGRRRLSGGSRPDWSPDGQQFMITGFSIPAHVTLMDAKGTRIGVVHMPQGLQLYSVPHWVSPGTIVAAVGPDFGDSIALLDVTDSARVKVKEVLWKRNFKGKDVGVNPVDVAYVASTGTGVFVGEAREGKTLYGFERGQSVPPRRLEPAGYDSLVQDLALSPDGRFALFSSNRSGPRHRGSAPAVSAPGPEQSKGLRRPS